MNVERVAAMLTLTAIHDIMKLEELCPTVMPSMRAMLVCGWGRDQGPRSGAWLRA